MGCVFLHLLQWAFTACTVPNVDSTMVEKRPFNNLNSFVLLCSDHVFVCILSTQRFKLVYSNTGFFFFSFQNFGMFIKFTELCTLFFVCCCISYGRAQSSIFICTLLPYRVTCGCCFLFIPLGIFQQIERKTTHYLWDPFCSYS